MFHTLLSKIAAALVAPLIGLLSLGGYSVAPTQPAPQEINLGATNAITSPVALFSTSLQTSISSSATAMTLVSGLTLDGTTLASSTYAFIIDESTASQEFVIADCTNTTCTNMQRGLSAITGTSTVAALQFSHRRGSSVKITDAPILLNLTRILNGIGTFPNPLFYTAATSTASSSQQIPSVLYVYGNYVNTSETQTVNGLKIFTTLPQSAATPSANADLATKTYVDGVAVAGAPNANATTKGIVQEATQLQTNIGTASGSTGAELYVNPVTLVAYTASTTLFATTTLQNLSTTTIRASELPKQKNLRVKFWSPCLYGSATSTNTANVYLSFNASTDTNGSYMKQSITSAAAAQNVTTSGALALQPGLPTSGFLSATGNGSCQVNSYTFDISNNANSFHQTTYAAQRYATTTAALDTGFNGQFVWASSTPITTIDIYTGGAVDKVAFATGTTIMVEGY